MTSTAVYNKIIFIDMKASIIILIFLHNCIGALLTGYKPLIVTKTLDKNGVFSKKEKLLAKFYYNDRLLLTGQIGYSRAGWNATDSAALYYNTKGKLRYIDEYQGRLSENASYVNFRTVDRINYNYDAQLNLKNKTTTFFSPKTVVTSKLDTLPVKINNSLFLLREYINDINRIYQNSRLKNRNYQKSTDNFEAQIFYKGILGYFLNAYGIPDQEQLIKMTVTIKSAFLVEDEFIFKHYDLIRKYTYKNNRIDNVSIYTKNLNTGSTLISVERFSYNW